MHAPRATICALFVAALLPCAAAGAGHPEVPVGGFPTGIAIDPATHTVYVGNGTSAALSLIDGRTCNARTARGGRRRLTAATAGTDPVGVAIDRSNGTVYVVNAFGTLAVVDGRRCNSS